MADSAWTRKFAFYAACQFRLGNVFDAGFAAAVLFEKYIEDEMKLHGLEKGVNGDFLFNAISQLSELDSRQYSASQLNTLRKIRNRSVIHSDDSFEHYDEPEIRQNISSEIRQLVDFVWKSMDKQESARYHDIDAIPLIHADLAVMGVKEFFQDNTHKLLHNEKMIFDYDFNDLLHMRRHFLQLGEYLQNGLLKQFKNLEVDLISHVDTTSGYVWLAINHTRPSPDHLRDRIRHSSASIFATPLDLRISIDFGGEDHFGRRDYYQFLTSDEARDILVDGSDFSIIDLEWYSFVTGCEPAPRTFASLEMKDRLTSALDQLEVYHKEGRIVTWERMLLGYVLPRASITYADIAKRLEKIIYLYYRFEKYRRDELKCRNYLDWVP